MNTVLGLFHPDKRLLATVDLDNEVVNFTPAGEPIQKALTTMGFHIPKCELAVFDNRKIVKLNDGSGKIPKLIDLYFKYQLREQGFTLEPLPISHPVESSKEPYKSRP